MLKNLLVEDNEMNRDMLSRRLVRKGYEVVVAVDGQAGVDMAASENPDLILMDMSLPVMEGWEVTRGKIRNNRDSNYLSRRAQKKPGNDDEIQLIRYCPCF